MRFAVFSTSSADAYLEHCVVAMKQLKRCHPDANIDLFLFTSDGLSEQHRKWLQEHDVEPVCLSLKHYFPRRFTYPIECFYHYAAPAYFLKRGYKVSMYLDGDIYCARRTHLFSATAPYLLKHDIPFAAGSSRRCDYGFEKVSKVVGTHILPMRQQPRPHSCVLMYNNQRLADANWMKVASHLFKQSIKSGAPRRGDDALITLIHRARPDIIPKYLALPKTVLTVRPQDAKCHVRPALYHFLAKPWNPVDKSGFKQDIRRRSAWKDAEVELLSSRL
jgi:hypothetical protein